LFNWDFPLRRPIDPPGRDTIDPSKRFGRYQVSTRDSQHGVNFLNSTGTPVMAAAAGQVVVAGQDNVTPYGQSLNLYGNLVILKHDLQNLTEPLYTLYGHLSEISVASGETVQAGDEIGLVGMSGRVTGSTFHFEIRLGDSTFEAARNPELWLTPLEDKDGFDHGALAGRVLNAAGEYVRLENILVERLGGPGEPALAKIYLQTYANNRMMGLPPWEESFAVGGLPAGQYQVSFWLDGIQQQDVQVESGKLTFVTFEIR